jgi:hypothetical protein
LSARGLVNKGKEKEKEKKKKKMKKHVMEESVACAEKK